MFEKKDFKSQLGRKLIQDFPFLFRSEEERKAEQSTVKKTFPKREGTPNETYQASPEEETVVEEPTSGEFNPFERKEPKLEDVVRKIDVSTTIPTFDYKLTPYTITKYLRSNKVVGEEANAALITVAIANGMHVLLEGDSGSGKSFVMENILEVFDGVYKLGLGSGQSIWYEADEINGNQVLFMPELQKAVADNKSKVSGVIELMKNLGEGKDASRTVTNKSRDGTETYTINSGITIASTIAKENKFKYDRETQRRFLILETDQSNEHIGAIVQDKVSRKMNIDISDTKETIEKRLSERIQYVKDMEDVYVMNPFIGYLQEAFPIMKKVQSYLDHYLDLFDGWGKFFSPERESFEVAGKTFVMLNLEDVYNVFSMYHSHFMRTIQSFNGDEDIPQFEPDWVECFKQGVYAAGEELSVKLNGTEIKVGEQYPELVEEWVNNQLFGSKVYTTDYKTGENIEIADLDRVVGEEVVESVSDIVDVKEEDLDRVEPANSTTIIKYNGPVVDPGRLLPAYEG